MPQLTTRFETAFRYASEIHRAQTRKGSAAPYITHLMAVASLVGENGGNEVQMIAALLHDAMEDQGVTRAEIEKRFGHHVADIVEVCTDSTVNPKPPWRERKERYIDHLTHAAPEIKLVSAADKLHNARSILFDLRAIGPGVWHRFTAGPDDVLWYFRALVAAFRDGWKHPLVDELDRTVEQIAKERGIHG